MKTALLVLMAIPFAACASEKKVENKSPLNYVNGENYKADTVIASVPVVKSTNRWTTISGKIVFTNPTFDPNTGIQTVHLLKKDKVIAQAKSNADGSFEFKGKFENGDYQLKVNSKTLVGSIPLTIEDYEVKNVLLPATLTSSQ